MTGPQSIIKSSASDQASMDEGVGPESELAPMPLGTILTRRLAKDPHVKYHLYLPSTLGAAARTFIAVHGITRNSEEQAHFFAPFAERYGVVLIAPLFSEDRFRDYQRLGREGKGERADYALDNIIGEVVSLSSIRTSKLYLFGYSGGGQFVHRYAMAHPARVARIAVAAAGWYTFPDPTMTFPTGIKPISGLPDIQFELDRFLSIPTCVLVGEKDVSRDPELRKSRRIDRQQGVTRVERGKRWTKVMAAAARAHRLNTPYVFRVLPRSNHSFAECMKRGKMGGQVFEFLFGQSSHSNY